jgi:hypothetical protein
VVKNDDWELVTGGLDCSANTLVLSTARLFPNVCTIRRSWHALARVLETEESNIRTLRKSPFVNEGAGGHEERAMTKELFPRLRKENLLGDAHRPALHQQTTHGANAVARVAAELFRGARVVQWRRGGAGGSGGVVAGGGATVRGQHRAVRRG